MVWTMANTTHASSTVDLAKKLRALSLKERYPRITVPLLVINGDTDTLASTQDSIDIATYAPNALLKLYPDDDHCATDMQGSGSTFPSGFWPTTFAPPIDHDATAESMRVPVTIDSRR
jgi:pimeloyl-ACP methyl ester carboxylesterase